MFLGMEMFSYIFGWKYWAFCKDKIVFSFISVNVIKLSSWASSSADSVV